MNTILIQSKVNNSPYHQYIFHTYNTSDPITSIIWDNPTFFIIKELE